MKWSNNPADSNNQHSPLIGFGGGCYWCTEAVFQSVVGAVKVTPGWIVAPAPDDTPSEGVIVEFDPGQLSVEALIDIHILSQSAYGNHSMRDKYRSAVYVFNPAQMRTCEAYFADLCRRQIAPVTRILAFEGFQPSALEYHNYYYSNPQRPYCQRFIAPKISRLKQVFGEKIKS